MTKPGLARVKASSATVRTGAEFRAMVRDAIHDPASALDLFVTYGRLDPEQRGALREAICGDGRAMGLDTRPLTNALEVIDQLVTTPATEWSPEPRSWQAYADRDGLVVGAPGRGALAAKDGSVRLHPRWSPPESGAKVDVEEAVDRLAALLWDARQRGDRWPNQLAEFADLFDR